MAYPSLPLPNLNLPPPISFGFEDENGAVSAGLVGGSRNGTLRIANLVPGDISDSESLGKKSNQSGIGSRGSGAVVPVNNVDHEARYGATSLSGPQTASADNTSFVFPLAVVETVQDQDGRNLSSASIPQLRDVDSAREPNLQPWQALCPRSLQKSFTRSHQRIVSMPTSMSDSASIRRWESTSTHAPQPRLPTSLLDQHQHQSPSTGPNINVSALGARHPSRSLRVRIPTPAIIEASEASRSAHSHSPSSSANITPLSGWASSIRSNLYQAVASLQGSVGATLVRAPSLFSFRSKPDGEEGISPTLTTVPQKKARRSFLGRLSGAGGEKVDIPLPQSHSASEIFDGSGEWSRGSSRMSSGKAATPEDEKDAISIHFPHSQSMIDLPPRRETSSRVVLKDLPGLPFSSSESTPLPTPVPLSMAMPPRYKNQDLGEKGATHPSTVEVAFFVPDSYDALACHPIPASVDGENDSKIQVAALEDDSAEVVEEEDVKTPTVPLPVPAKRDASQVITVEEESHPPAAAAMSVPDIRHRPPIPLPAPISVPSPISISSPTLYPSLSRLPTPILSPTMASVSLRPGPTSLARSISRISTTSRADTVWSSSSWSPSIDKDAPSPSLSSPVSRVKSKLPIPARMNSSGSVVSSPTSSRSGTPQTRQFSRTRTPQSTSRQKGGRVPVAKGRGKDAKSAESGEKEEWKSLRSRTIRKNAAKLAA